MSANMPHVLDYLQSYDQREEKVEESIKNVCKVYRVAYSAE